MRRRQQDGHPHRISGPRTPHNTHNPTPHPARPAPGPTPVSAPAPVGPSVLLHAPSLLHFLARSPRSPSSLAPSLSNLLPLSTTLCPPISPENSPLTPLELISAHAQPRLRFVAPWLTVPSPAHLAPAAARRAAHTELCYRSSKGAVRSYVRVAYAGPQRLRLPLCWDPGDSARAPCRILLPQAAGAAAGSAIKGAAKAAAKKEAKRGGRRGCERVSAAALVRAVVTSLEPDAWAAPSEVLLGVPPLKTPVRQEEAARIAVTEGAAAAAAATGPPLASESQRAAAAVEATAALFAALSAVAAGDAAGARPAAAASMAIAAAAASAGPSANRQSAPAAERLRLESAAGVPRALAAAGAVEVGDAGPAHASGRPLRAAGPHAAPTPAAAAAPAATAAAADAAAGPPATPASVGPTGAACAVDACPQLVASAEASGAAGSAAAEPAAAPGKRRRPPSPPAAQLVPAGAAARVAGSVDSAGPGLRPALYPDATRRPPPSAPALRPDAVAAGPAAGVSPPPAGRGAAAALAVAAAARPSAGEGDTIPDPPAHWDGGPEPWHPATALASAGAAARGLPMWRDVAGQWHCPRHTSFFAAADDALLRAGERADAGGGDVGGGGGFFVEWEARERGGGPGHRAQSTVRSGPNRAVFDQYLTGVSEQHSTSSVGATTRLSPPPPRPALRVCWGSGQADGDSDQSLISVWPVSSAPSPPCGRGGASHAARGWRGHVCERARAGRAGAARGGGLLQRLGVCRADAAGGAGADLLRGGGDRGVGYNGRADGGAHETFGV